MSYRFWQYLAYRRKARNEYSLHSPFMFDLYNTVFKKARKKNNTFAPIEILRKELLHDPTIISITDLGAGSKLSNTNQRSIAAITKSASKKPRHARFLALLAQTLDCKNVIELGTSMGLTTAYLAKANPQATITTIEGCPQIHQKAIQNFDRLQLRNIMALQGNFDETLPDLLEKMGGFDLLYVDGNHTREATLRYFYLVLKHVHNFSVIVFDDIYWSEDMTRAWNEIIKHEKITASVDAFEFGIVFFRKELSKQHFVLKL